LLNNQQKIKGTEGTFHFMSPESLKETEDKSGYDGFLSDLWSLGVTFYCMLYKGLPFYDYNIMHLFKKIQEQE